MIEVQFKAESLICCHSEVQICLFDSRGRLETNAEQWLRLLTTIQDLLSWILKRQTELKQTQQTVGGDLPTVQRQSGDNQVIL